MTQAQAGHERGTVFATLRQWFEDTGAYPAFAVAFLVFGSLFVLAEIQSPSMLQWNGTGVHATQSGGIAFYSFQGQTYTLNVPTPAAFSSTVYIDPAEPSTAMFSNPVTRWTEAGTVAGPYAAAAILIALGFARKSRRRRLRLGQRSSLYAVKDTGTGNKRRRSAQGPPS